MSRVQILRVDMPPQPWGGSQRSSLANVPSDEAGFEAKRERGSFVILLLTFVLSFLCALPPAAGPRPDHWLTGNLPSIIAAEPGVWHDEQSKAFGRTFRYTAFGGESRIYSTDPRFFNQCVPGRPLLRDDSKRGTRTADHPILLTVFKIVHQHHVKCQCISLPQAAARALAAR